MTSPLEKAGAFLMVLLATSGLDRPVQGQEVRRDLVQRSSIIFEGSVTRLGAGAMPTLSASPDLSTVRVDRVLDKPAAVSLAEGDLVTVKLNNPADLHEGVRAVFYTNGRVFGEGLAVDEVGHEIVQAVSQPTAAGATAPASGGRVMVSQARQQLAQEELQARVRAAPVVVVGRVTEVRTPSKQSLSPVTGGRPVSEHDPEWREATVQVQDAIKGANAGEEVVVRFPASEDVMWFDKPKLQVGEISTLILHPDTISGESRALRAGAEVPAYTLERKGDVLPQNAAEQVRSLARP
jgi:hypothetical protein